ncbi:class I SAM-dependent methyltransferase [Natronorubrum sp. FCH18a]|uniref:class I SAM-dependent methyltransferase n=1 Tax=Natronorubrum sp. FCH18a TaxID=3447018 RepID=UPI003F50ED8F
MRKSVEEFASAFDDWAEEYDEDNDFEERRVMESLVVEHASPGSADTVVDFGTGTGAIALKLADDADEVIGRDISTGMLEQARKKAAEAGIENVEFGTGRFRAPNVAEADVVVTNLALHHLCDAEKREAVRTIADLGPRRIVFGEAMYFDDRNPVDPLFSPDTVYPSTVGHMVDAITAAGYAVTAVERVHEEAGVLVAERFDGW